MSSGATFVGVGATVRSLSSKATPIADLIGKGAGAFGVFLDATQVVHLVEKGEKFKAVRPFGGAILGTVSLFVAPPAALAIGIVYIGEEVASEILIPKVTDWLIAKKVQKTNEELCPMYYALLLRHQLNTEALEAQAIAAMRELFLATEPAM